MQNPTSTCSMYALAFLALYSSLMFTGRLVCVRAVFVTSRARLLCLCSFVGRSSFDANAFLRGPGSVLILSSWPQPQCLQSQLSPACAFSQHICDDHACCAGLPAVAILMTHFSQAQHCLSVCNSGAPTAWLRRAVPLCGCRSLHSCSRKLWKNVCS